MRTILLTLALGSACVLGAGCEPGADEVFEGAGSGPNAGGPLGPTDVTSEVTGPSKVEAVPVRRLNRAEYSNTMRDLLGDTSNAGAAFPADSPRGGFTNNAEALSLSALQVGQYFSTAESLVKTALTSPQRASLVKCDPKNGAEACASQTLGAFARRAFRRTVTAEDTKEFMAPFLASAKAGDTFDESLSLSMRAILTSPYFLFRIEDAGGPGLQGTPVSQLALASRLSYFLWSSMPDEALLSAAEAGKLGTREEIEAQAVRMMADPKAQALFETFATEWLLAKQSGIAPDKALYPGFDDALKASMVGETRAFITSFLLTDRPVSEMLTAKDSYLDSRLATFYGLPAPSAPGFSRVEFPGSSPRIGLLTQGLFLSMTAIAKRGSPSRRGTWVLSNLMCSEPPPPPPDAPTDLPAARPNETVRQMLETVGTNAKCGGCHKTIDPIGLGLENFDAVGAFRDKDNGAAVDASGTLPDGQKFTGVEQLAKLLTADTRFNACAATKLFEFATGKEILPSEKERVAGLGKAMNGAGNKLRALTLRLVNDVAFRNRAQ
jgi:Protein of unknown function (DUF1592)/Protein of unknown function (DUF1588)/Protein of unknown function (DUF1587)/Protein of unknown function (DUF1595)/Protein of unknown function (DUF1585)